MLYECGFGVRPALVHRVALRYMPSTSLFDRGLRPMHGKTGLAVDFAQRPLWLVKGVDRCGGNDFVTGH